MKMTIKTVSLPLLAIVILLTFFCTGCANFDFGIPKDGSDSAMGAVPNNEPYYPTDFKDLLIPGELGWNHDNSMMIKTDSFSGGILNFSGRVEVISLTNFFITSMVNNGWKMPGSVRSKNVLLSFFKPGQTCMIRIIEGEFGLKTEVYIYITKDLTGATK